jgi:Ca2+-binding RTX toxin-like protein
MRDLLWIVVAVVAMGSRAADAQVCTQSSPGVAQISTGGVKVTINMGTTAIPKVNGASCGFAASSIEVVGVAGSDTVIFNFVPPSVAISLALGTGPNNVTVYTTNNDDNVVCGASNLDRDGDATPDLAFGTSELTAVVLYLRNGDDVVDCTDAGYKVKLVGGDGDDTLVGGPFADSFDGGAGNDELDGGDGNDSLDGGAGNDTIDGGAGNDMFVTKSTFDGNDTFTGGAGNDSLSYGGRTTSVIAGGAGSEDSISDDLETIKGGKANDTLDFSGATRGHFLWGGAGNDTLRGGAGADKLYGEAGNDALFPGGAKDSVIDGGAGDDTFGSTSDGLVETIKCGAGVDTTIFTAEDKFIDCE